MRSLKVAISTPVDDNLYSLLVTQLSIKEPRIKVVGVLTLRVLSFSRLISEFKRLRLSIIRKIWNKYGLRKDGILSQEQQQIRDELISMCGLKFKSLRKLCAKNKIKFKKVKSPNNHDSIKFFMEQKPDIILSIGSVILREPLLQIPSIGVLNVHLGILPNYRGIGVTEWPIIESDGNESIMLGVTLHFMERGVDTGPIILKKNIPLKNNDTVAGLEARYLPEMVRLMLSGVRLVREGNLQVIAQEKYAGKQYFSLHQRMKIIAEKKLEHLSKSNKCNRL